VSLGAQLLQHLVEESELPARFGHRTDLEETVRRQGSLLGRTFRKDLF